MPKKNNTAEHIENGVLLSETIKKNPAREGVRSRKFAIVTYIEVDAVIRFLKQSTWVQHWALCVHDKDLNADGSMKEEHIHVLLYTFDAKTSRAVAKNFDRFSVEIYRFSERDVQNTFCEICFDMVTYYRYLIHQDDPDKYQYARICRITDSESYWHSLEATAGLTSADGNLSLAIVNDMIAGVSERDLITRYGNFYVCHRKQLKDACYNVIREESFGLKDKDNKDILSFFRLMLSQDIPFSQDQVNVFFNVLTYLKVEVLTTYNSDIEFYLKESEEKR